MIKDFNKRSREIIKKFFEEHKFVKSNIDSFNSFVDWRMQKIIDAEKELMPAVIPVDAEEVKFEFGEVSIKKPIITEADGSERPLYPSESRMRNLTYSAPVFLEVALIIDGKERDRAEVQIAEIPVMVKSHLCYLSELTREQLVERGEDPIDPGGYFIINGTERALVLLEDLAPNRILVAEEKSGPLTHTAKVFSSIDTYKISHSISRTKDGLFLASFSNVQKVPFAVLMKSLGMTKDKDIANALGFEELPEDVYINLIEFMSIKDESEAKEFVSKTLQLALPKDRKIQKVESILDTILLPHLGTNRKDRIKKAYFLAKMVRKLILLKEEKISKDDKDHYMNKRIRMSGDLLEDLFRTSFKGLKNDIIYIFTRGVRRGKVIPISSLVRSKFMTDKIKSAMATGNWTGNRQGVSQRLERDNPMSAISQLRRVTSLLDSNRESFEARALHPTHLGRLCAIESPEGKNIGLRKTLALMATITTELEDKEYKKSLKEVENSGLEKIKI
tara:strand:- start:3083 stop:4594 length:1512 start_codon:yes stop_codon:yes gene_type:complete